MRIMPLIILKDRRFDSTTLMALTLAVVALICACSDEEPTPNAAAVSPAGPRFTTAEDLVNHVRELMSKTPPDNLAFTQLSYPETPLQEKEHEFALMVDETEQPLEETCYEAFGRPYQENALGRWPVQTIELISNDGARALYNCSDEKRHDWQLQLVRIGDEWHISGYSSSGMEHGLSVESVQKLIDQVRPLLARRQALPERIRNGEFQTVEEVRQTIFDDAR